MVNKYLKSSLYAVGLLGLLIVIFNLGPKVSYPVYEHEAIEVPSNIDSLIQYVQDKERALTLKAGNEAKFEWAHIDKRKTPVSIVYLHGFSASHHEGFPIHQELAKMYGMNLYLARLEGHGMETSESFKELTPADYLRSAAEAIQIGRKIGEKVIVISCSTGSTLAIILDSYFPDIIGHIMYSPNIDIADPLSDLVLKPWGSHMTSLNLGGDYNHVTYSEEAQKYWNSVYHKNGIFVVKTLVRQYLTPQTIRRFTKPLFIGAYYKDESKQDDVVSVAKMEEFFKNCGTPNDLKKMVKFPDAESHVICSSILSKSHEKVLTETQVWLDYMYQMPSIY